MRICGGHRNVVALHDACWVKDEVRLVMPFHPSGDLKTFKMHQPEGIVPREEAQNVLLQMSRALAFIHEHHVVSILFAHGDRVADILPHSH